MSNRVAWGKSDLKIAKFVSYSERGFVQITEKGKKILEEKNLTLKELKEDQDYKDYYENKNSIQIDNNLDEKISYLSPEEIISDGFSKMEYKLKLELIEKLKKSKPYYFEKIILKLFKKMGYGYFQETKKSVDGGIDGIINQDALGIEKIYTQAKRYTTNNVGEKDIRNFKGAMDDGEVSKGIFVTTSDFDQKAKDSANSSRNKIILINGNNLTELIIKYNLGVQVKKTHYSKDIDEYFFNED